MDYYIAWSDWVSTAAVWQDYFRGEDADPR
jgi:hypothetical protein